MPAGGSSRPGLPRAMTAGKVRLARAGVVIALAWWQAGIKQPRRSGMIRTRSYDVTVAWTGNRGGGTSGYREYGRDHEVAVSGDGAGDADRPQIGRASCRERV